MLYKRRYRAPREFRTKTLSDAAERALRDDIMAAEAGIPTTHRGRGPTFWDWAEVTYTYAVERKKLQSPGTFDDKLKHILEFWGKKPDDASKVKRARPTTI